MKTDTDIITVLTASVHPGTGADITILTTARTGVSGATVRGGITDGTTHGITEGSTTRGTMADGMTHGIMEATGDIMGVTGDITTRGTIIHVAITVGTTRITIITTARLPGLLIPEAARTVTMDRG